MSNEILYKNILTQTLGFCDFIRIDDQKSITRYFKNNTTGLYCLFFDDKTYYIGQAVNIPRRISQHNTTHNNITHFSFFLLPRQDLNSIEEFTIKKAEQYKIPLTNIMHVSNTIGTFDLNKIINPANQDAWLKDNTYSTTTSRQQTTHPSSSRYQYKEKHQQLASLTNYDEILFAAKLYTKNCIPEPFLTEKIFWSVSCLPSTTRGNIQRLFCFNINMMETFVAFSDKTIPDSLSAFINISQQHLASNKSLKSLARKFNDCAFYRSNYRAAGHDQLTIETTNKSLFSILQDDDIIQSAKILNLRLMRKGINIYSKYHCPQLADQILTIPF